QFVPTRRATGDARRSIIDVRILSSGDAYLGLRGGWPPGQPFTEEIDRAFRAVRNAPRLIIDVRGNRGGNREPVLHVLRNILPAGDPIIEVAAYRMRADERPPESFDVLRGRGFGHSAASDIAALRAEWQLPPSSWSEWHVAKLGRERGEARYDGPILILVDEQSASATALLTSTLASLDRVIVAG